MHKLWMLGCAAALGLALPSVGFGQCCGGPAPCAPAPCPPPPCFTELKGNVGVVTQTDVPTCGCYKSKVWPVLVNEVKGCAWDDTLVCREVAHQVPVCKTVPVCVTDPCTGCTHTEYKTETCLETVVSKEVAVIPVKREYDYNLISFDDAKIIINQNTCTKLSCEPKDVTTRVPCDVPPACPCH